MTTAEEKEHGVLTVSVNYEKTAQYALGAIQFLNKTSVDLQKKGVVSEEMKKHISGSIWFLRKFLDDLEAAAMKKKILFKNRNFHKTDTGSWP